MPRARKAAEPAPDVILSDVFTEANPEDQSTDDQPKDLFSPDEEKPTAPDDGFGDREARPRPLAKRTSAASLISMAYAGVGTALIQSQSDIPVGRVLQFQAPLAGNKFDELIAGTWLDTFLQPLVKQADKVEGIGALIMFPLLVGAYERNPAIGTMVEPILREVIRANLVDMAPVIRKRASEEKRAASALGDLGEAMGMEKGADPIDAVLSSIFAAPPGMEENPGE